MPAIASAGSRSARAAVRQSPESASSGQAVESGGDRAADRIDQACGFFTFPQRRHVQKGRALETASRDGRGPAEMVEDVIAEKPTG